MNEKLENGQHVMNQGHSYLPLTDVVIHIWRFAICHKDVWSIPKNWQFVPKNFMLKLQSAKICVNSKCQLLLVRFCIESIV